MIVFSVMERRMYGMWRKRKSVEKRPKWENKITLKSSIGGKADEKIITNFANHRFGLLLLSLYFHNDML